MKRVYPKTKINLTERPEWEEDFDPTGKMGDSIFENAIHLVDQMGPGDLGDFAALFGGRGLSEDEEHLLWNAYVAQDRRLEEFSQIFQDSGQWAVEEATLPRKDDVKDALENAFEAVNYGDIEIYDLEELQKLVDAGGEAKVLGGLLENIASIEHKKGHYDIFLSYDPEESPFLQELKTQPFLPSSRGVFDWMPPSRVYTPALEQDLFHFYDRMKEGIILDTFHHLKKNMGNSEIDNRLNFWPMAKRRVSSDAQERHRVKGAIRDVLKDQPAELGANPFFGSSPRARRLSRDLAEMEQLERESSIFRIKKTEGDPPERYVIEFSGAGLTPEGKIGKKHQVMLDLGLGYPTTLPNIHWMTPIKHPNINAGGTPCLGNIGMNPRIRLVDIVEVLWDMNRMAIYSRESHQDQFQKLRDLYGFPVDGRILRDKAPQLPKDEGGDEIIIMGRD